jgi:hypothetical protein
MALKRHSRPAKIIELLASRGSALASKEGGVVSAGVEPVGGTWHTQT